MNIITSISSFPNRCSLAIYGSGETGRSLLQKLADERKDIKISCFFDSSKVGVVNGIPLLQYDSKNTLEDGLLIVIASVFWDDIVKNLSEKHADECILIGNELLYKLSPLEEGGAFVYEQDEFAEKAEFHDVAVGLFSSADDRELYRTCLSLHHPDTFKRQQATLRMPALRSKHVPYLEHISLPEGGLVVEGGVFNGKDANEFCTAVGGKGTVLGFEPVPELVTSGPYWPALSKHGAFQLIPMALWSKRELLTIGVSDALSSGSRVDQCAGDLRVPGITLDEYLDKNSCKKVDLIKMDIEGAELEALSGMESTIKSHHPALAIAIYHHKDHLYKIPIYIQQLGVPYRYYLSSYTGTFIDTVFYAIPIVMS